MLAAGLLQLGVIFLQGAERYLFSETAEDVILNRIVALQPETFSPKSYYYTRGHLQKISAVG